jgi:hypothetical protein
MATAQMDDLTGGVFIAHNPVGMMASVPAEGYCQAYKDNFAIMSCEEQVPQLMYDEFVPTIWFVLSAFPGDKMWCGTEFGFGQYNPDNYVFTLWGPCTPGGNLEIPSPGWPGPLEGTAIVTTDAEWIGNFEPVYYFEGYMYDYLPGLIPLDVDPPTGFGGWGNCLTPPESFAPACYPAMGLQMDGVPCCPSVPEFVCCVGEDCYITTREDCDMMQGEWHPEWDTCDPNPCVLPRAVCCVLEDCYITTEMACADMMGMWHPEWDTCDPNPCLFPRFVCCVCEECYITTQDECFEMGGEFHPEWDTCDPNPCPASPTEGTSWGAIKAIYR